MKSNWTLPKRWTELTRESYAVRGKKDVFRAPLSIEEPTPYARTSHPVTSGVPIPESALAGPGACRLLDEKGREVPLQAQALARWPDGSVKWLLLDFQIDSTPKKARKLALEFGAGVASNAVHPNPVTVRESAEGVIVATGGHELSITHHQLPLGLRSVFTARGTEGDRNGFYASRIDKIEVEERGPLRAVVRVSGWHERADRRQSMPWIMRFTVWANCPVMGIQHTFIVSDEPMSTFWRGIGLHIPAPENSRYRETEDGIAVITSPVQNVGGDSARRPSTDRGTEAAPTFTSMAAMVRMRDKYLPKENYFHRNTNTLGVYLWPLHGDEMDLRPVMVRRPKDFVDWTEKYPDAFHHIEGGALSKEEADDAFSMRKPCPSMGDMRGRSGMGVAKTHDVFLAFGRDAVESVRPFDKPLFAFATPQYYAHTRAFGAFHPYDPKNFPDIEAAMETHLEWVWRHIHEWSHWLGIFDYGDYLSIYDTKRGEWWKYDGGRWGWLNGEVNSEQGLFLQFLRTGKRKWLEFAEAAARHRVDCDQLHWHDRFPELVGGMHRHYMLEHWSGQIDCGHIWVDGALNLYYLFGYRRGLECAIEGAEMAARFSIPNVVHHGDTTRESNNTLRCLARVYEATRDDRYREWADVVARGYLCCFDASGWPVSWAEAEKKLHAEFAHTNYWQWPEIMEYNWHGFAGYQYIGYLAPAVRYWATIGRTRDGMELQKRFDCYSPALDLGNEGQFFGEMWLDTHDPKYLMHIVRGLPGTIQFPIPGDGTGTTPGAYSNPRLDHLYGIPYVLAAFYDARARLKEFAPKPGAKVPGYRSRKGILPVKPRTQRQARRLSHIALDLSSVANRDPRRNPFQRSLDSEFADALPPLQPGQIGFQPHSGLYRVRDGYFPVSAYHVYPSSASTAVTNHYAVAGLPLGGEVEFGGVPFRFLNPDANEGRAIVVLDANESATIPVGREGQALYMLGHVHGKKHARQISQFSPKVVGYYEIKYADGSTEKIELINGKHFDSLFSDAYATDVTHVANLDWLHVFAHLTDDHQHLNVMRLPLRPKEVESVTFHATDEDWGLLLVAATLQTDVGAVREPPLHPRIELEWCDFPGWPDIKLRRTQDKRGTRLMTPSRLIVGAHGDAPSAATDFYEVELTVSGDPHPYAAPQLRVENAGAQVLANYCLPGNGQPDRIRFFAKAENGTIALDLFPAPNHASGKLPQLGLGKGTYAVGGSYGNWRAPEGNYTRIESVRIRPASANEVRWPEPTGLRYGFLLPGASGEAARGGLVVDHEDTDDFTSTTMKWKAGGFRADVPNGRYKVIIHHTNYAKIGTISVELTLNGKVAWNGVVDYETIEMETEATDGHITIEWRQPEVNVRCPRYAIRGIVLEKR